MLNVRNMSNDWCLHTLIMSTSLAVLGLVSAITIDNQFVALQNECYRRIAIGEKLTAIDIMTSKAVNSLEHCQNQCSKLIDCLTINYGVDNSGNISCLLSPRQFPQSTIHTKDTLRNPDYDLYIKIKDCHAQNQTQEHVYTQSTNEPTAQNRPYHSNQIHSPNYPNGGKYPGSKVIRPGLDGNRPILGPDTSHEQFVEPQLNKRPNNLLDPHAPDKYGYHDKFGSNEKHDRNAHSPFIQGFMFEIANSANARPDSRPDSRPPYNIDRPDTSYHYRPFLPNDRIDYRPLQRPHEGPSYSPEYRPGYRPDYIPGSQPVHRPQTPPDYHRPHAAYDVRPDIRPERPGILPNYQRPEPNYYRPIERPHVRPSSDPNYRPARPNHYEPVGIDYNIDRRRPERPVSYDQPKPPSYGFAGATTVAPGASSNMTWVLHNSSNATSNGNTSYIVTLNKDKTSVLNACFRRALAGKRVSDVFVRRTLPCEKLHDCQWHCSEEKRYVCEGFNYRIDASGHGEGMCELVDLPLSQMDIGRDLYPDRNYDFYEWDRNALPDCRKNIERPDRRPYLASRPPYPPPLPHYPRDRPNPPRYPPRPYLPYPPDTYLYERDEDRRYWLGHNRPHADEPPYDPRPYGPGPDQKPYGWNYRYYSERSDYLPRPEHNRNSPRFVPYELNRRHANGPGDKPPWYEPNYFDSPHWPESTDSSVYWGVDSYGDGRSRGDYLPIRDEYLARDDGYAGVRPSLVIEVEHDEYSPHHPPNDSIPVLAIGYNDHVDDDGAQYIPPSVINSIGDVKDCSHRMGGGMRFQKRIVKVFYEAHDIYECEMLCYTEKNFACKSYSYRYSGAREESSAENCYLSDEPFAKLDMYGDLQPDRNFDVYAMNGKKCGAAQRDYTSDCFWRIRSGIRFDHKIIVHSTSAKSLGQCELQCINSYKFVCRSFSFRYGPPSIGSTGDNCLLSDWPVRDVDPRHHLVADAAFELYERGSYGHGCEVNHFVIASHASYRPTAPSQPSNKHCYIGYSKAAKLLPRAIEKVISANDEAECRDGCTDARQRGHFPCMSFSYRDTNGVRELAELNCELSVITLRDLRINFDYIHNDRYWLYAWNIFEPKCTPTEHDHHHYDSSRPAIYGDNLPPLITPRPIDVPQGPGHNSAGYFNNHKYYTDRLDVQVGDDGHSAWSHYSVKGYPCRQGSRCEKNVVAGFYSCEIEGSEVGAWDYCCRPDYPCGYSDGYDYPWCYVGASRTQWRKCNERYYPISRPSAGDRPYSSRPSSHYSEQSGEIWTPAPHDRFDPEYLEAPRPGGFDGGRYWPVAYLHKQPPPTNQTTLNGSDGQRAKIPASLNLVKNESSNQKWRGQKMGRSKSEQYVQVEMQNKSNVLSFEEIKAKDIGKELRFEVVDNVDVFNGDKKLDDGYSTTEASELTTSDPTTNSGKLFKTGTGNLPSQLNAKHLTKL